MGTEAPTPHTPQVSWRPYVWLLVLVIGAIVVLQITGMHAKSAERGIATASPTESLISGDWYIKLALVSPGRSREQYLQSALASYRKALPWPAAYRRIGIVRQGLLNEPGTFELNLIDSPKASKGLASTQITRLHHETAMWRDVYSGGPLDARRAGQYVAIVRKLNLGPLKEVAVAEVCKAAGEGRKSKSALNQAVNEATRSIAGAGVLLAVLAMAAVLGAAYAVVFLVGNKELFTSSPAPRIQPSILLMSFLAYLVSFVLLELVVAAVVGSDNASSGLTDLALQAMTMVIAFAIGLISLGRLAKISGESVREIGLRFGRLRDMLKWGVGGYCAALPVMGVALVVSYLLTKTVLRGIETPEHPLVPMLMQGGAVFVVALLVASILAPLVEETFFRGALYGSLRGTMGIWPAALLSGAIFAVVHPTLPGQFLPILGLGVVLALIREKTGSLVPGMICHAVNNTIALLVVWLLY